MSTFLVSKIMLFTVFLQNIKKINGHPMILFLYVGQSIKKQRYHFADKGLYSQRYGFSGSHVWMWELDRKEGSALKNWCFWTSVPEKTFESPLDSKDSKPVNPKRNQPWIFIGRTDAETSSNTLATCCKESTHWKRPWCWERLRAGEEMGNREWD